MFQDMLLLYLISPKKCLQLVSFKMLIYHGLENVHVSVINFATFFFNSKKLFV